MNPPFLWYIHLGQNTGHIIDVVANARYMVKSVDGCSLITVHERQLSHADCKESSQPRRKKPRTMERARTLFMTCLDEEFAKYVDLTAWVSYWMLLNGLKWCVVHVPSRFSPTMFVLKTFRGFYSSRSLEPKEESPFKHLLPHIDFRTMAQSIARETFREKGL